MWDRMTYVLTDPSWKKVLAEEFTSPYMRELSAFVSQERATVTVYPPQPLVFRAFNMTPYEQVKVVILGQDPYHGPGQAEGLCFSVPQGIPFPPSLKNIYFEMESDLKAPPPASGHLGQWAAQGVFLLNTTLTVRQGLAHSHKGKGWERFTDAAIEALGRREEPLIFMLWGKPAQEKARLLTNPNHLILKAPHPSPLSAHTGFFGCRHFSLVNEKLEEMQLSSIKWVN